MMDVPCKELRRRARESLKGNYGKSLGLNVVGGIVSFVGGIFTCGQMRYGIENFYVAQQRGEKPSLGYAFSAGFSRYGRSMLLWFLRGLFLFLWSILLFFPAIIKAFSYSAACCVSKDYDLGAYRSLKQSKKLMWSFKGKLLKLRLSFIGWIMLANLLPVFGYMFLQPYVRAAEAEFYVEMLDRNNVQYYDDTARSRTD